MPENFSDPLELFFRDYPREELCQALDDALLVMVLHLRHDPGRVCRVVPAYEILSELKTVLQDYGNS